MKLIRALILLRIRIGYIPDGSNYGTAFLQMPTVCCQPADKAMQDMVDFFKNDRLAVMPALKRKCHPEGYE